MTDIAAVKASTNLLTIIEDYLGPPLQRSGRWRLWRCPFHDDHGPSFACTETGDSWTCFGACAATGDVLDFLQRIEKTDLPGALGILTKGADPAVRLEQVASRAARQARALERQIRLAQESLLELRAAERWAEYHANLTAEARDHWRRRGVPDSWQDTWELGWRPDFVVPHDAGWLHTSSLTIPLRTEDNEVVNIKHRLLTAPDSAGKYRYEVTGLGQPMFLTDPDKPIGDEVIAVEGEIKAMVFYLTLDDPHSTIVGLPGIGVGEEQVSRLRQASRITLLTDPGTSAAAYDLAKKIGLKKCRSIITPQKIDDGIIDRGWDKRQLRRLLEAARPF